MEIAKIILLIFVALLLAYLFAIGITGYEKSECLKWKEYAKVYEHKGYYLTKWQADQCLHYGIEIEAPILK